MKQGTKKGGARGASEVQHRISSNHCHCRAPRSSSHIFAREIRWGNSLKKFAGNFPKIRRTKLNNSPQIRSAEPQEQHFECHLESQLQKVRVFFCLRLSWRPSVRDAHIKLERSKGMIQLGNGPLGWKR